MFVPIELEKRDGILVYRREGVEKVLPECEIIVNPVEPINTPKNVTRYLMVEFPPILLRPNEVRVFYLKFPIEIGVFAKFGDKIAVVDVFSFERAKYTLYGDPRRGIICRWFKSGLYGRIPEVDPTRQGIMKVDVRNGGEWAEMSKVVVDCYAMKIYYDSFASCWVKVRILNNRSAETSFVDEPLLKGMKRAIELYTTRRLMGMGRTFLMEWGI